MCVFLRVLLYPRVLRVTVNTRSFIIPLLLVLTEFRCTGSQCWVNITFIENISKEYYYWLIIHFSEEIFRIKCNVSKILSGHYWKYWQCYKIFLAKIIDVLATIIDVLASKFTGQDIANTIWDVSPRCIALRIYRSFLYLLNKSKFYFNNIFMQFLCS